MTGSHAILFRLFAAAWYAQHRFRLRHRRPAAERGSESSLVEVKYIRHPGKLEEYLCRWWQARCDITHGSLPQGRLAHLKFERDSIESRDELSDEEIKSLKSFFAMALEQSGRAGELTSGRLAVRYIPNRKLPIKPVPLAAQAVCSEKARESGLFRKLKDVLNRALDQFAGSDKKQLRAIFVGINLSTDVRFLWPERVEERLDSLRRDMADQGVLVIHEKVNFL